MQKFNNLRVLQQTTFCTSSTMTSLFLTPNDQGVSWHMMAAFLRNNETMQTSALEVCLGLESVHKSHMYAHTK